MTTIGKEIRETLFKKLKESNKSIAKQSVMVYLRNIIRLYKLSESKTSIVKPTWLTVKLIKKISENKQSRHLFLAAVKFLQSIKKTGDTRYKKWYAKMIESSNAYKKIRTNAKLSTKEISKIGKTSFKDFCVTVRKLIPSIGRLLHKSIDTVKMKDLMRIQEVLVLLFYCELPLRNEIANVVIKSIDKQHHNFLKKTKHGYTLVMNQHKTAKKVGIRTHKLPKSLARILNKFIPMSGKLVEHNYLLSTSRGKRMSTNALSKYLTQVTKHHFGTGFSSQIIRILFAQHHMKNLKEAEKASEKLGHKSLAMTLSYAKQ